MVAEPTNEILSVDGLKVHFPITTGLMNKTIGYVKAVDDVNFKIGVGETLGIVGESGCGKTTTGRAILRAIDPTDGKVLFRMKNGDVVDTASISNNLLDRVRQEMQIVFQDPFASLNPRLTVFDIVADPLKVNNIAKGQELEDIVSEMLRTVGLSPELSRRYPHAFSGGQRQRIGLARSLIMNPRLVIADEPVSALDVSVQAQILNLMQDLQEDLGLTYLFISHDLSVVQYICHRVAVMYVGKLVELSDTEEIFSSPKHPYTQALLDSVPVPNPKIFSGRATLEGEIADPSNPPRGCYFHPRCAFAKDICKTEDPPFKMLDNGSYSRCHFAGEIELPGVAAN